MGFLFKVFVRKGKNINPALLKVPACVKLDILSKHLFSIIGLIFSTYLIRFKYSVCVSYLNVPQMDECFSLLVFKIWSCFHSWQFFSSRWEVIANYMNQHSTSGMKRTAKDVINKAKNLQRLGKPTMTTGE